MVKDRLWELMINFYINYLSRKYLSDEYEIYYAIRRMKEIGLKLEESCGFSDMRYNYYKSYLEDINDEAFNTAVYLFYQRHRDMDIVVTLTPLTIDAILNSWRLKNEIK